MINKKIIIIIVLFFAISACGYKPIFSSKKNISKYKFNILKKKFKKEDLKTNKINISFFDAGNNANKFTRIYKTHK